MYDDALGAFSKVGVGLLLARRLVRRLNGPEARPSRKVVNHLIDVIDNFSFHHYWEKLRVESDIASPELVHHEFLIN